MTVLGKILVFINLVASLATAGFIAMAFTTRTNWATAYKAANDRAAIINASKAAEVEAADRAVKAIEAKLSTREGEKLDLAKSVDSEKKTLETKDTEIKHLNEVNAKAEQNVKDATEELNRRKLEVDGFVKRLDERDRKIKDIDIQMAKLRDDKTQFETSFKVAKDRNEQMRQANEQLRIEVAALRAQVGTATGSSATSPRVVPPDDVRGTIRRVDGEYATISVGTDAGVRERNVLQVFRTNPPEFLGTLEILAATPQSAVGRLIGTKKNKVQVNDEVAAKLLP